MTAFSLPRRAGSRLSRLARGGTASIFASSAYSNGLRIVSSMALTRLLSSEAFGAVGAVMLLSTILTMLSDVGLYPFVVRHADGGGRRFLDEVWTLRIGRAVVLSVAMAAAAWPMAQFMEKPELAPILAVYALSFVIEGAASMAFATAVREQKLWRLTLLEGTAATLQLVISVGIALWLRSSWSLVIAMLVSSAVKSVLSYVMFPGSGRRLRVSGARARELWGFSRYIAASSMLSLVILQSDKLVLARLMPLAAYGHYVIAATLAGAPLPLAYGYAQRVLYPAYAEAAREGRLAGTFYAKRRLVVVLYMAAVGALAGGAGLVVSLLYDPRYDEVAPLLSLLAVSAALYLGNSAAEEAMVATGRTRWTLYANMARVTWLVAGGTTAVIRGEPALLVAVVGLVEAAAAGCWWYGLARIGVLRVRQEALGIGAALGGAALGYGAAGTAAVLLPGL